MNLNQRTNGADGSGDWQVGKIFVTTSIRIEASQMLRDEARVMS